MPSSSFSSTARAEARTILSRSPYRTTASHPPRPLAGLFHAVGRALNAAFGGPARWLYHHALLQIGHGVHSAFGGWWIVVVALLAAALGVGVAVQIVRRRARVSAHGPESAGVLIGAADPDALERGAVHAEQAGDNETAVRLRFRAGLLRLQRGGVITQPEEKTDRELSGTLHSTTFDALAQRHEKIVYARDEATATDVDAARTGWPRVLVEAGSKDDPGTPPR